MDKSPQKVLIFKEHGHQLLELKSIGYFNHKEHLEHSKIQLNIYTSLYFISNGQAEMKMGENTHKLNKGHLFYAVRVSHENTSIMTMNRLKCTG